MFFLSVFSDDARSVAVLLKRDIKSVKKKYYVKQVVNFEDGDTAAVVSRIKDVYDDGAYTTVKKKFSQNGRPPRRQVVKPEIVVCGSGQGEMIASALRNAGITVQVLDIGDGVACVEKQADEKGMGYNVKIPFAGIIQPSIKVCDEGRLFDENNVLTNGTGASLELWAEKIQTPDFSFSETGPDWSCPLSAVLFFSEKVRLQKIYRY